MAGGRPLESAPRRALGERRLRILFYAPRSSFHGRHVVGEATHIRDLFLGFAERGHAIESISDVNVRDFWRGRRPAADVVREAVAIRRRAKRFEPDAWLVYGPNATYPDLFGWWIVRTPYFLVAVDPWASKRVPRRWRVPFRLAFRMSLRRARKIGAQRPRAAERLRSLGVGDDKLELFLPAVKIPDSVPGQAEARRQLGLPASDAIVLCLSRLPEGKDRYKTDAVIDLVSIVDDLPPNTRLVIVGDGDGRRRVLEAVARVRETERVHVVGFAEDPATYYAASDVFANPITLDRPWVSVLEAQAFGRPVVVMRSTSAEATVVDGRTGLLADDLDSFRDHLVVLASDRERCRAMGREARDYAARTHSVERQIEQIEQWVNGR